MSQTNHTQRATPAGSPREHTERHQAIKNSSGDPCVCLCLCHVDVEHRAIFSRALGLPHGPKSCISKGFVLLEASAGAEGAPGRLVFRMEVTLLLRAFAFKNGFL